MGNTPNIRFKGYVDDWEQRALEAVCEEFTDGDWIEAKDQSDTGIRLIQTGNIGVAKYIDKPNNRKWIAAETFERLRCEEVFEGDILISRLPQPAGRACIVPNLGTKMITAVDCTIVRTSERVSKYFLLQYLSSPRYFNEVNICLAGGTRQRISRSNLAAFDVPIPTKLEEQNQIGAFFQHLDDLVTLHQRNCDEIKRLKKYMLQKMFPLNGERIPEIRFAGFTDLWEQRKLGDVFAEYSEKNHSELPPLTVIQGGGTVLREESERNLQYDKSSLSGYKMVHKDDFIVHLRSFEGGLERANSDGIISPAYHTFHGDGTDSRFYYSFFRSRRFIDGLLKPHVYGIRDGKSIDIDGMKTIMIPVPSYEEQKKIGEYIESFNHLITLHQRKCDDIKEVKKFMLQNMFPQKG